MKRNFRAISPCTLACLLAACGPRATDGSITVLDIEKAIDTPRAFDLAEISTGVEFIPLDESVPVDDIAYFSGLRPAADGGFHIISAGETSPVQHFDRTGRFISTIGQIGRGPYETLTIAGVATNDRTGDVYIDGGNSVVAFDAAGGGFARNDSVLTYGIAWSGDRLLVLQTPMVFDEEVFAADSVAFIDLFDSDLRRVGSLYGPPLGHFLGISADGPWPVSPPFMSHNGARLLVKQGRGDTLYQHVAGRLTPAYRMNLGRYTPPAEVFGPRPTARWTERHFSVDYIFEGERYIIVTADNREFLTPEGNTPRRLVFDRRDLSSGFSAMGGAAAGDSGGKPGLYIGGVPFTPTYIRDNRIVGHIRALDIAAAAAITDPRLKALAATTREDGNPVIAIVQLK